MMNGPRTRLTRRLSSYWKLEAANVILMPAFMVLMARGMVGVASLIATVPMCLLLIIGAAYWRGKLKQLEGDRKPLAGALFWIAIAKWPARFLTLAACFIAVLVWVKAELAVGRADQWVTTAAAILAALEYVNYYHRQLQHFDHAADFKRLMSGRGFRRSQMSVDLESHQARPWTS